MGVVWSVFVVERKGIVVVFIRGLLVIAFVMTVGASLADVSSLRKGFANPPNTARPHTWWHWMNGNVTKEGIVADLDAMKEIGLGGAQIFDAGCEIPEGSVYFNTPDWMDLVTFACKEAEKRGIEICLANCSGWSSSGGPWNTPENSMKVLRTTEASAKGPGAVTVKLPKPDKTNGFYEDIAVLAMPAMPPDLPKLSELKPKIKLTADGRVEDGSLFMDGNPDTAYVITNGSGSVTVDIAFDKPITAAAVKIRLRALDWTWMLSASARVEASDDGIAYREIASFPIHLFETGATVENARIYPFSARVSARHFRLSYKIDRPAWTRSSLSSIEFTNVFPVTDLDRKLFRSRGVGGVRDSVSVGADDPGVTDPVSIIDLTGKLADDDMLTCELPEGEWTLVRFGYASNGRSNHPASKFGGGLEVDKLSSKALDIHFDHYVGKIADAVGCQKGLPEHTGRSSADDGFRAAGFNNVLVDSYEVGTQTWTRDFDREFERRAGYAIRPWLPALMGRMVCNSDATDRFLWDYRRVMCDMFAENYAGALRRRCHERGLKLSLEGYGNCTSDDLQYGAAADVPMGEFWSSADVCDEGDLSIGNATFPASIAHVWGQKYVGAEAFTAGAGKGGRWEKDPAGIRAQNDAAWTAGINRMIYHRYAMQPWTKPNYLPGMTMGPWGTHFERTLTWWKQGKAWIDYQTRGQFLLQQGNFVADALLFNGEDVPNEGAVGHMPKGYAGDACTVEALKALNVVDGEIVAPSGSRYRMLVLPDAKAISLGTLGELERLAVAGATIVGRTIPEKSRGLRYRKTADDEVKLRAARLWDRPNVLRLSREDALRELGIEPDFTCDSKARNSYIHRRLDDGTEIYFIANHVRKSCTIETSFRVEGLVPERWNAEDGSMVRCRNWRESNGRTLVSLDVGPDEGVFVVFRAGVDESVPLEAPRREVVDSGFGGSFAADWELEFPVLPIAGAEPTGETKKIKLPKLVDWTTLEDPDMKYFSGTATYRKSVKVDKSAVTDSRRVILDLGDVKNFAEVAINGRKFQVLWHEPFRLDVTDSVLAAKDGLLEIEIKVTNLWPNRLIGDEFLPDDADWEQTWAGGSHKLRSMPQWVKEGKTSPNGRHTFTTWKHWHKTEALLPSGMKGDVSLCLVAPKKD